jgi:hypothetical protein
VRMARFVPTGLGSVQWAAGGTEDKRWDSGCYGGCSVLHVGRRLQVKRRKTSFSLFPCSVDEFVGRRRGIGRAAQQMVGPAGHGQPAADRPSSSISFREGLLSRAGGAGGCGCGWAWTPCRGPPAVGPPCRDCIDCCVRAALPPKGLRESALQLIGPQSEVTRRISTESTADRRTEEQKNRSL